MVLPTSNENPLSAASARLANRFEGRLFTNNGHLCLVLDVDLEMGVARVSFRENGERRISQIPVTELSVMLGNSAGVDSLNSDQTASRVAKESDGWWFATREGRQGPYASESDAQSALTAMLLETQRGATDST